MTLARPIRLALGALPVTLILTGIFLPPSAATAARPKIGNVDTLERVYTRWSVELVASKRAHELTLPIGFSKGLSPAMSRAGGLVTIDLESGRVSAELAGFPTDRGFDLWLVDSRAGSSAAIDESDDVVRAGALAHRVDGTSHLDVALPTLPDGFKLDRTVITPAGVRPSPASTLISGSPSLLQRLFFHDVGADRRWAQLVPAPGGLKARPEAGFSVREVLTELITEGERLFVEETFSGNGRTCASCHPPQNNFTLDPEFIATLPPDDPLFVHENEPALAQLENAVLLRDFAMILANPDGFEDPTNKFVMRGVPHTLGMGRSIFNGSPEIPFQNLGWSGDGAPESGTLRDFAIGAITQHATQRLDRIDGTDFRLPTETELDELEAFQLSLGRSDDLEILTMTLLDPDADEGRVLFSTTDSDGGSKQASKCILCHGQAGALSLPTGRNQNFDVGVEDEPHPADATGEPRPRDGGFGTEFDPDTGGFGDGRFATPSLVEAADTAPFFHNNVSEDLDDAIFFYQGDAFQQSPAGVALLARDTGGAPLAIETFKLGAFLRVINTLENVRSAVAFGLSAQQETELDDAAAILDLALLDVGDGIEVLGQLDLHPEVVTDLGNASNAYESARATADVATRNALIDDALAALRTAQPRMVVPRVRIADLREGDIVAGSVTLTAETLDVDLDGVRFTVDGTTLCTRTDAPFSCSWDTTLLPDGVYTVTILARDYLGGTTVASLDLEVDNEP